jgi:hypothetical protein
VRNLCVFFLSGSVVAAQRGASLGWQGRAGLMLIREEIE